MIRQSCALRVLHPTVLQVGLEFVLLEKQFLERNLLEKAGLPRLSLFYMR